MVGRIVVGSPGGPAEESSIPDGDVPESDAIVEQGAIAHGSGTGGEGNGGGGAMGPGMMRGRGRGWFGGLPFVGGALGLLGLVGGLLYWAFGRGDAPRRSDASAMEALKRRYERGDIDEAEFRRRRERLADERNDPPK